MNFFQWKVRRELIRIGQQLRSIPEFFTEPFLRWQHDAQRPTTIKIYDGKISLRPKIALFLLFQPHGIATSTIWTCQHLVTKGYAPFVVSNSAISEVDRQALSPHVWRIAQRPNFGYDFGGYRDGIWLLNHWGIAPEVFVIINDSIWFPLQSSETLLDRMESSEAQFVGALQLDPLRTTEGIPARKRPFFGSFFLMAQKGAWQHSSFQAFWRNYRITSNKYKTIRRGERGLTHSLMDAGLRCEAMYTRNELDDYIERLDSSDLADLLTDLVTIDDSHDREKTRLIKAINSNSQWRKDALKIAFRITEKQNILATAPITSLVRFNIPYLKKSKDWNNLYALHEIQKRINQGTLPKPHKSIRQEIKKTLDQTNFSNKSSEH